MFLLKCYCMFHMIGFNMNKVDDKEAKKLRIIGKFIT